MEAACTKSDVDLVALGQRAKPNIETRIRQTTGGDVGPKRSGVNASTDNHLHAGGSFVQVELTVIDGIKA